MRKALLVLVVVTAAFAGQYDLLVVYCEGGTGYTISAFDSDTFYDSVTYMDATYSVVTEATCANYGCVLSWDNYYYLSGQGDEFGNYILNDDGKVILCVWGITQCYGVIVSDPTLCPINGGGNQYSSVNLGTIYEGDHPMIDGDAGLVSTISSMYYWVSGSMESGALRVADNSAGTPLAAINADENCAALNICPGSYKSWSGDGWMLMSNTIHYLMEPGEPDTTPPYVTGMDPDDGETGVSLDTNIVFECKDDGSKIDLDSIDFTARDTTLSEGRALHTGSASMSVNFESARSVAGDLDIDDSDPKDVVCTFDPADDLNEGDTISCTVSAGLADSKGNEMADDFVWTFDTEGGPGVTTTTWGAIKAEF
jgi:hypothetical protein